MKKLIYSALAAVMALSFAACGSNAPEAGTTLPSAAETTESTESATATGEITEEIAGETTEATTEAAFEEIILVDNQDVTFKITSVENDPVWGYTLKVFLENKTDKELMFTLDNTSVNGFMCDPFWAESVAAGKRSNTSISWFSSDFEENGIETVTDITFSLRAYDNADWTADDILNETFTVNP